MSDNSLLKHRLKPVDTLSLVDKVEQQLMELLVENEWQPGDLLPKEVELAEAFGVSRTVVREALVRLKTIGLVESIKHKGSVVAHPDILTGLERVLHPKVLNRETLQDVFEMRLVLEVGMADLVFSRITPVDLEELQKIVSEEPAHAANGIFDIDYEVRFHGKLYQIAGNQTLQRFQGMLLSVFQYVHESGLLEQPVPDSEYVSHQELVDALRHGTPEAFRIVMRKHLDNHFRRIL